MQASTTKVRTSDSGDTYQESSTHSQADTNPLETIRKEFLKEVADEVVHAIQQGEFASARELCACASMPRRQMNAAVRKGAAHLIAIGEAESASVALSLFSLPERDHKFILASGLIECLRGNDVSQAVALGSKFFSNVEGVSVGFRRRLVSALFDGKKDFSTPGFIEACDWLKVDSKEFTRLRTDEFSFQPNQKFQLTNSSLDLLERVRKRLEIDSVPSEQPFSTAYYIIASSESSGVLARAAKILNIEKSVLRDAKNWCAEQIILGSSSNVVRGLFLNFQDFSAIPEVNREALLKKLNSEDTNYMSPTFEKACSWLKIGPDDRAALRGIKWVPHYADSKQRITDSSLDRLQRIMYRFGLTGVPEGEKYTAAISLICRADNTKVLERAVEMFEISPQVLSQAKVKIAATIVLSQKPDRQAQLQKLVLTKEEERACFLLVNKAQQGYDAQEQIRLDYRLRHHPQVVRS